MIYCYDILGDLFNDTETLWCGTGAIHQPLHKGEQSYFVSYFCNNLLLLTGNSEWVLRNAAFEFAVHGRQGSAGPVD